MWFFLCDRTNALWQAEKVRKQMAVRAAVQDYCEGVGDAVDAVLCCKTSVQFTSILSITPLPAAILHHLLKRRYTH